MSTVTTTTAALDLLRMGARITFPGDYYMQGEIGNGYIAVGTQFGGEGRWDLSEEGFGNAVDDLTKMAAENGYGLDGTPLPSQEGVPSVPADDFDGETDDTSNGTTA